MTNKPVNVQGPIEGYHLHDQWVENETSFGSVFGKNNTDGLQHTRNHVVVERCHYRNLSATDGTVWAVKAYDYFHRNICLSGWGVHATGQDSEAGVYYGKTPYGLTFGCVAGDVSTSGEGSKMSTFFNLKGDEEGGDGTIGTGNTLLASFGIDRASPLAPIRATCDAGAKLESDWLASIGVLIEGCRTAHIISGDVTGSKIVDLRANGDGKTPATRVDYLGKTRVFGGAFKGFGFGISGANGRNYDNGINVAAINGETVDQFSITDNRLSGNDVDGTFAIDLDGREATFRNVQINQNIFAGYEKLLSLRHLENVTVDQTGLVGGGSEQIVIADCRNITLINGLDRDIQTTNNSEKVAHKLPIGREGQKLSIKAVVSVEAFGLVGDWQLFAVFVQHNNVPVPVAPTTCTMTFEDSGDPLISLNNLTGPFFSISGWNVALKVQGAGGVTADWNVKIKEAVWS